MSSSRYVLGATALMCAASLATPSLGAPATTGSQPREAKSLAQNVHYRRWGHRHYRHYDDGPGIYLRLGRRHHHHHHHWD